jgi:succinate-semialdehyde dehydrogenase/glutarate-semialdehyde dehydrogenase
VDIAWAAQLVAQGSFINAGQLCTAIERIYVLEEIAEAFTVELVRLAEAERIGPGTDPAPTMGPLIDDRHRRLVHAHVCDALERGATLRTGGEIPDGPGFHYPPTVLVGCDAHMAVMADETFGPVAAVQAVPDLDHAVREANGGRYGLAATVLSNRAEGMEAARRLTVGTVWVNTYLVGTEGASCQPRGDSGLGAVGDRNAVLRAVSSPTTMHIATGPSGPRTGAERSVEVTEHAKEPS